MRKIVFGRIMPDEPVHVDNMLSISVVVALPENRFDKTKSSYLLQKDSKKDHYNWIELAPKKRGINIKSIEASRLSEAIKKMKNAFPRHTFFYSEYGVIEALRDIVKFYDGDDNA